MKQNDLYLAERLRRREPEVVTDLYDRYGKVVYGLLFAMVRNQAVAEDLLQETFLRVWNQAHHFRGEGTALGAWILTVARNRGIDYTRSSSTRMGKNAYELDVHEHPLLFADMEREVMDADRARIIRAAIQNLTEYQRLVINMAYFEGLSQSAIAERLGQPLGTVKGWTRSGLRHLREEIAPSLTVSRKA